MLGLGYELQRLSLGCRMLLMLANACPALIYEKPKNLLPPVKS